MTSIFKIFCFVYLIIPLYSFSQNLVINPGFEEYKKCAKKVNTKKLKYLNNWVQPTKGTCDYINLKCKLGRLIVSSGGYQAPHTGNGFVGIICYNLIHNYREYIEGELLKPLIKDSLYCVSMYVSLAKKSYYGIDGLGMFLSKRRLSSDYWLPLRLNPQISNNPGQIINDTCNWVRIFDVYKAKGGEKYITIGNFWKDEEIQFEIINGNSINHTKFSNYAYYYIDDVAVIKVDDTVNCICRQIQQIQQDSTANVSVNKDTVKQFSHEIILHNVYFETDKWDLLPSSYKELDEQLLKLMNDKPDIIIEISGHTDNTGTNEHNLQLSENRANAVSEYLISKGISINRIIHKGYGNNKPIAPNDTKENKAKNRRVEFKIVK